MLDLSRRAVACWLGWVPGMATAPTDSEPRSMRVVAVGDGTITGYIGDGTAKGDRRVVAPAVGRFLPDFDDEATCHLMLPMARKAWGALAAGTLCEGRLDTWTFYVRTNPWAEETEFVATTEVGALIAALEFAPEQP